MDRTTDDVLKLLEQAKLNPNELLPVTQSLYFSKHYGEEENEVKLLEIDSKLLSLVQGEKLTIRGDADEPSVLCTNNKTFEVREAETSNSLLLMPNLSLSQDIKADSMSLINKQIHSVHYKYLELKLCRPRIGKLLRLLETRPYSPRNLDERIVGFSIEELLNTVQCSEHELTEALRKFKIYEIGDHWQILDFDYHFSLLSSILNVIDTNSWNIKKVNKQQCIDTLKDIEPEHLLHQCFDFYFQPLENLHEDDTFFKVNNDEVSKFCAQVLLKHAGKFNLGEFLNIWQQSVPEGVTTNLSLLRGIALVDSHSSPPIVWHFPATDMPSNVAETFALLFETKEKWQIEEISPYLQDFISDKTPVNALLNKYSRASTFNGIKYYSAKHCR